MHKCCFSSWLDSHGDDDRDRKQAVVNSFENMNLGASQFVEGFY